MLEEKMRIGGKKVEGENGNLDVLNPFNGEKVEPKLYQSLWDFKRI